MHFQLLQVKSTVFSDANPFEVSDYVRANVGQHSLRLSSSRDARASLRHRKAGSLDLCRLSYGAEARVLSEGLADIYHLQFILRGRCSYALHDTALDLAAGHILVINPEEPIDLTYSADCEKFIVRVPSDMLNQACSEHRLFKPNELVKFNRVPYKFGELQSLLMLLDLICEEAESGTATPQMLQHYNRVVTSKLMTMLKHNVCLEAPGHASACFDRLLEYIDNNIKGDLSAEDLAQQARMSLRSLYLLFEKHTGTTPKNLIRQRKLEKVHAALRDANQPVPNVTAIALEYGFNHLGRFAELYKSAFGVLPSETLRARMHQP